MKRTVYLSFVSAILLTVIGITNMYSQDWPQFRGVYRDCSVTGFKAPQSWPSELKQVWKVSVGTGDASPVLAGNKVFLHTRQGDEEVILCMDALTGKELWKNSYPCIPVTGAAGSHPGPRSTPSVADGKIVTFGVSGILSCLDANTGKVIWRRENPSNAVPEFFTGASTLIYEGLCIIHVGKANDGQVLALDLQTGAEKWKWAGDGPTYSSPSIMKTDGNKSVVIFTERNLMALSFSDGRLLWQIPTTLQKWYYNAVSPYISGQVIYYTGQGSGSKAIKIEKQGDKYVPKELWSNSTTGAKWNTPVLKDGFLYGFTDTRRIYCINASDGKTAWVDNTVNSDFATLVDCGSILIGLPSTGNLIVFKPDSKAYTEVVKYKVADTPVYTYPVVSGNAIYIKDAGSLMMYRF